MTRTTVWRRAFGTVALAAVLGLSACSGHDANSGSEQEVSEDEQAQVLAFVDCMRDNGFEMPDPEPGQAGLMGALRDARGGHDQTTVDEDYEQAFAACEEQLPAFAGEHGEPDPEAMLKLAECLREEGLDVPDDLYSGDAMHDIDRDELSAAMEACREVTGVERGGHG